MSGRAALLIFVAIGMLLVPLAAEAQQTGRVYRVGILRHGSPPDPFVEAFRQGLRELGYTEGRNITIEHRWTEGRDEQLPALAADLVGIKVDVIVAAGAAVLPAKQATSTIPIVMPVATDPVGSGLVATLRRPGGNVTGFAFLSEGLPGKWMELLKEVVPRISRVAVLRHPANDPGSSLVRTSKVAAQSMNLRLQVLDVGRPDDLETALLEAQKNRAEAVMILPSSFFFANRNRLVELASKHRLPTIYDQREFVVGARGFMSYGPNLHDLFRRAASYVDRILKGAKPADLPVEQPTKFELVINLKTAKALGLTIPPSLLLRADQVIE